MRISQTSSGNIHVCWEVHLPFPLPSLQAFRTNAMFIHFGQNMWRKEVLANRSFRQWNQSTIKWDVQKKLKRVMLTVSKNKSLILDRRSAFTKLPTFECDNQKQRFRLRKWGYDRQNCRPYTRVRKWQTSCCFSPPIKGVQLGSVISLANAKCHSKSMPYSGCQSMVQVWSQ